MLEQRCPVTNPWISRYGCHPCSQKMRNHMPEHVGRDDDVAVDDQQDFSATDGQRIVQAHGLALIGGFVEQAHPRIVKKLPRLLHGVIGGVVVDNDDLELRVVHGQKRAQRVPNGGSFGEARNDHCDKRIRPFHLHGRFFAPAKEQRQGNPQPAHEDRISTGVLKCDGVEGRVIDSSEARPQRPQQFSHGTGYPIPRAPRRRPCSRR